MALGAGPDQQRASLALATLVIAAAAAILVASASPYAQTFFLIVLTGLAAAGAYFLFAIGSGLARPDGAAGSTAYAERAVEALSEAVHVLRPDGTPVWANGVARRLLAGQSSAGLPGLEAALGGGTLVSQAVYRLSRAALDGAPAAVDLDVSPTSDALGSRGSVRRIRLSVSRIDGPVRGAGPLHDGPLLVWRVADITTEHESQRAKVEALNSHVADIGALPVGIMTIGADGGVHHINAAAADWLGLSADARRLVEGPDTVLRLTDLFTPDGAEILAGCQRKPGHLLDAELDLVREDGLLVPVRVLCRSGQDGRLVVAAVDLRADDVGERTSEKPGARFSRFFRSAPLGIATLGRDGRVINANPAFTRMIQGGVPGDIASLIDISAADGSKAQFAAGLARVLEGRAGVPPVDVTFADGGAGGRGSNVTRRIYMSPLSRTRGLQEAAILYVIDVTEEKALEAKFAQSQKMEAVGKLAGFVAHDFNNMLTAIIGFSDFLLQTHRPSDPAHSDIINIKSSAVRAAGLVGKLLALARQQTLLVEPIQLGEMMTDLTQLLKRSLGERIGLEVSSGRDLWYVKTDKLQLEQAIINLAVNAKDAMPDGGRLTVTTRNVTEREVQRLQHPGMQPGEYVLVEIADTGTGMPKDVLDKIFEPFFTTKAPGKGTGLGLATVYGIVKQTGGYIYPESAVGAGTTFRIYLPRYHLDERDEAVISEKLEAKKRVQQADLTGTGCVLLVEDEDVVRSFSVRALSRQGYTVLEAADGLEALELMARHQGKIDLVVSDVVMPGMDGPTMLKEMRKSNPDVKIIFVSGYPNEAFQQALGEETFAFLPKPFSLPQLAAKVKEQIGR
ncbi:MAG: response regulator [Hyphomicrobiaceae bacterium]|nr:response regulator [Hyphomicrobiaceae bacterium]